MNDLCILAPIRGLGMGLGTKIRALRDERNLSLAAVEDGLRLLGIEASYNRVRRWENGGSMPKLDAALALAKFYHVPLDFLADDEMETPPTEPGRSGEEKLVLKLARKAGFDATIDLLLDHLSESEQEGIPG